MPRSWSPGMQPLPGMIALLRKLTVRTHEGPTFTFVETISAEDYVKAGNTIRREHVTFQRPPTGGDALETTEGAAA